MAILSSAIVINQPAEKVFAFLSAVEKYPNWQPALKSVKVTPAGPVALGSVYAYTTEVLGRAYETKMQVSAFELNKKWAVKTIGLPRSTETVYLLEAAGAGTKLTLSMEVPAGAYPAAAEGAIKQQMQKSLEDQCKTFKQLLEK